jgi:hypothetical protein
MAAVSGPVLTQRTEVPVRSDGARHVKEKGTKTKKKIQLGFCSEEEE